MTVQLAGAGPRARRRRTSCSGPQPPARRRVATACAAVLLASAACAGCAGNAASATPTPTVSDTYGGLPTFLPTAGVEADSMLTGSPGRPAVTSEGDAVEASVDGGTVRARVVGPVVPGEGLPYVTPATTCTWTVTLWHATTRVPISPGDFTTLDGQGNPYHPRLVRGERRPPRFLEPGQRVRFRLRVVMATGEGVMRWAPGGPHVLAVWDFVVEND